VTTRQVTIQDVARAAGVSRQTVSNVLNSGGRVGDAARARVLEAMAALNYHPHQGARSLRSRRTRQIAYVMPRIQLRPDNYIMQQFLQSLAAASARRGYSMVIVVPDSHPLDEMRRLIASRSVDAFLLSELQPDDPRVVMLAEAGTPFACFGRTGPALPQQWVDIDNHEATTAAVEHVLSRGFKRLAFLGYGSGNHWDNARAAGFKAALARAEMPADQAEILLVEDASARRKVRSLLGAARPAGRPDAIVTGSDLLAAVVYSVAAELRLRIGHDLAVTGFDGSVAAGLMHPRLTSVAIPIDDIARRVVARALQQIDHGPDQRPGEIVSVALRLGASTGNEQRMNRPLDERVTRDHNAHTNSTPTWKRFQGGVLSSSAALPAKGEAAPSPLGGPWSGIVPPVRRVTIADVAAQGTGPLSAPCWIPSSG
jgi:DNA-binding LacI/PurR family transcriptional regulator